MSRHDGFVRGTLFGFGLGWAAFIVLGWAFGWLP